MAFHRNDIEIERQRIIGLLGNWRVQEKNICQTAILEIGVGTGISRLVLSALLPNATYFPTDISRPMLVEYRRKYSSASPIVCDAEKLPFKNESFELIVCCSLIHHLPGDRELLLDTHRALKRGGIFLGMREPKRAGCDFWFRFHHLAKRYGDRRGMRLLAKRILGAAGGWRAIWRTELSGEEFIALDAMEIRGAILRPTPTKKRGGIDSRALGIEARRVFGNATVVPFGCCTSFIGFFTILFQKRMPHSLLMIAYRIDRILLRMGFGRIFDSFSVSCRKQ
jgi:SAM-dependent methyltransferase